MPAQNSNDTSSNMLGIGGSEDGVGVATDISNGAGQDNPAFETEVAENDDAPTVTSMSESSPSSQRSSRGDPSTKKTNGHHNDHVEMVPLNPQSMTITDAALKSTNGMSSSTAVVAASNNNNDDKNKKNTAKSNDKAALDNMYSEYFRPVNTRRKLLRGEKLYVTRDQRAQNRSWKWIAFWGGVFTILAAALLTGILAATGIIMSKSKPFLGTSDSLVAANNNLSCDDNVTSSSDATEGYTSVHDFSAETTIRTSQDDNVVRDFDNTLDDGGGGGGDVSIPWMPTTTIDPIIHWLTRFEVGTPVENVVTPSTAETTVATANVTKDRGRSLDQEVTVVPLMTLEEITLFPTLPSDVNEDVGPAVPSTSDEQVSNISSPISEANDATLFPTLPVGVFDDVTTTSAATSVSNDTAATDGNVKPDILPANETTILATETDNVTDLLQQATTTVMEGVDLPAATNLTTVIDDATANSSRDANLTTVQPNNATMNDNVTVTPLDERLAVLPSKDDEDNNETLPVQITIQNNDTNNVTTGRNESISTIPLHENVTMSLNVTSANETSSGGDAEHLTATESNVTMTTTPLNVSSSVLFPSVTLSDVSNATDGGANFTFDEATESSYADWTTEDFSSWNETSEVTEM